jgi:hypothetical protein
VSLQAQIFEVVGIFTDIDDVALSLLMMIGKARAPWPMRPPIVVADLVRVPPNLLQLWMNLTLLRLSATMMMLSGSSVRVVILSFFEFLASIALTKASKFLFAVSFSFTAWRCASQLFWRGIVPFYFLFYLLLRCYQKGSPILGSGAPDKKKNNEDFVVRAKPFDR